MDDLLPVTRYPCPLPDCGWYRDEPLPDVPDGATQQDLQDLVAPLNADVERDLSEHFEGHALPEWVAAVSELRQQLAAQPQQILCLACVVANHNAQRQGIDVGPPNPAALIANGSGICLEHLQIADGPVMGDRTAGGIVLPGNASRLNGGTN